MAEPKDPHLRPECVLPVPYPEPKVTAPNIHSATLLLEDYAGSASEMTAINQYLYHYFTLQDAYPDVAELEECISIIEMKHLELLSETIKLLGVSPAYRTLSVNMPLYWNAAHVYYGVNIYDQLAADISAENQAIQTYRLHQQMITDPHIQSLLQRIIMDEEHHLALFREAAKKHCPGMAV